MSEEQLTITSSDEASHPGGNIVLMSGKGWSPNPETKPLAGSIIFQCEDTEMMRIDPDGKFYIKGEYTDVNQEVFDTFSRYVQDCIASHVDGECVVAPK
jgi:hypothetical protein